MIGFAIDLAMIAVFLKIIAAVLPGIQIDGWMPAIVVAAVMAVAGTVVGVGTTVLIGLRLGAPEWITLPLGFVLSTSILLIALKLVPGVRLRRVSTGLLVAVLLSVLRIGAAVAMAQFTR
jgi:uncharacterized membrane protein YvlD (DUF360 family)